MAEVDGLSRLPWRKDTRGRIKSPQGSINSVRIGRRSAVSETKRLQIVVMVRAEWLDRLRTESEGKDLKNSTNLYTSVTMSVSPRWPSNVSAVMRHSDRLIRFMIDGKS